MAGFVRGILAVKATAALVIAMTIDMSAFALINVLMLAAGFAMAFVFFNHPRPD